MDIVLDTKGKPPQVQKMIMEFPYRFDVNGVCENLDENNTCKVYEERPDICNIEKFKERAFPDIDEETFFELETNVCKLLMKESGKYTEEDIEDIYATQE